MYPEGWLLDTKGETLLSFEKDSMNPMYEGYIAFWLITGVDSKEFKYRKRTSKDKAISEWNSLIKRGWQVLEAEGIEEAA
tara:strand:- start:2053 stop:2292 length:240 start_codon:yes stop_codon:yes gene_type:complete